jgi:gliding motility-associated-like protein
MKRFLIFAFISFGFIPTVTADHIAGGELYYVYAGISGGQHKYDVTLRLYMLCSSIREFNNPAIISIFNQATGVRIDDLSVSLTATETLNLTHFNACITNPPPVCYTVGSYKFTITVPPSPDGYIITAQVIFRVDGMNNLTANYDQVGATYTAIIPSNASVPNAPENSSAQFIGDDLVVMCAQNSFSYSFAATDKDGDQLLYSLCNAYRTTGSIGFGDNSTPPPSPPYESVPYGNGYSGSFPLGDKVGIDPFTGMIIGIAPASGTYVVTVCVQEIRQGIVIATQRKDLQITIASCTVAAASLPEDYMLCGDSKTLTASNLSSSPLIETYNWKFINQTGNTIFESTNPVASHTFADTGTYTVKLIINSGQQCSDSTTAIARVYPGFTPGFDVSGTCINKPVQFTDLTTTVYGTVNSWKWNFGETATGASTEQNPFYNYIQTGNKNVSLITENTFGCRDTVNKTIAIFDKPPIALAYRDTLICPPDALRLKANGRGNFSWTPAINMNGSNTASPEVSPTSTTKYVVELNDDGCTNTDSVMVRVVNNVSLQTMPDTVICLGDASQLNIVTDGLQFVWNPAAGLNNPNTKNPVATPENTTTYTVSSSISSCIATAGITIRTVPYPAAFAGPDTTICFNTVAQLQATTDGSSFNWLPDPSLNDINSPDPVVKPVSSRSYILYTHDTRGCPKPGIDTVTVTVLKKINAFAGRDTTVVTGQPLQLQASGGTGYKWIPAEGLSADDVANPVAMFSASPPQGRLLYKVIMFNEAGCMDSAYIQVKVFATLPDIFVPSAFTPNSDGRNDFFQPVAAGMQSIEMFHVYNRWGQLIYSANTVNGRGWDGSVNGRPQPNGSFVWILKARDFTGRPFIKKGTVTLIR